MSGRLVLEMIPYPWARWVQEMQAGGLGLKVHGGRKKRAITYHKNLYCDIMGIMRSVSNNHLENLMTDPLLKCGQWYH